jgi:hypothetical protein
MLSSRTNAHVRSVRLFRQFSGVALRHPRV